MAMSFEIVHQFPALSLERPWRECLSRASCPAHYDSPEFFLEPYFAGKRPFAVLAVENGAVTGVLTGFHLGDQVKSGIQSRPQICIGSGAEPQSTVSTLTRGLLQETGDAALVSIYCWSHADLPSLRRLGFRARELEGNVVLDLTKGSEALFNDLPKDRRRNIRFAEKNGVKVEEVRSSGDIRDAYDVYRTWREAESGKTKGEERTFEVFEKAALLRANRRVFIARVSGQAVAINIFRFFPGGLFESAANSSLEGFLHLKVNELLQWKGIEWACANGFKRHSLGGAHTFLRRFGGEVVPIIRYRLDRTLMRRHDLQEAGRDLGRKTLQKLSPTMQNKIRSLLERT